MNDFKGRHFGGEIVLWAVRWYCRYAVSYRDLEAMMTERGVAVDHCTIYRWVQRFAPEMEKRLRWQWRRPRSRSWRIHELPLAHELLDGGVNVCERVASGRVAEHERLELGGGEHRHPLLDGGDGPGDRFEHADLARTHQCRRRGGACRCAPTQRPARS